MNTAQGPSITQVNLTAGQAVELTASRDTRQLWVRLNGSQGQYAYTGTAGAPLSGGAPMPASQYVPVQLPRGTAARTVLIEATGYDCTATVIALPDAGSMPSAEFPVAATVVRSAGDFPAPSAGVITLPAGTAWELHGTIDLEGNRIVCAGIVAIYGTSSETAFLTSTGLSGAALISSSFSLPMQNLSITSLPNADAIALSGGGTAAVDWKAVNFVDVPSIGTAENMSNFLYEQSAFLNAAGLVFDGTTGTVGFSGDLFEGAAAATAIALAPGATITRRLRVIYSSFVCLSGETAINVDSAASTVPDDGFILDTCNFAGGGTYLGADDHTSAKSLFVNNVGIQNSASVAHYYMIGNATATTISTSGTPVKVAGTTTAGPLVSRFTVSSSNRATFTGVISNYYIIEVVASLNTGTANQIVSLYVASGSGAGAASVIASSRMRCTTNTGGRVEAFTTQAVALLSTDDFFEVWVANDSSTSNVTVSDLQVIARRLE